METDPTVHDRDSEEAFAYAIEQMHGGIPLFKIEEQLVQRGLSEESASAVIARVSDYRTSSEAKEARSSMNQGAVWFLGGIVVTVATYVLATGGGTYVVAWGAVVFGGIQFVRGYMKLQNY
ncbi:MAG: hypothetical protein IPI24_10930 [Ignavibacteria bacterium]|nr:hypothetical protein [Ignavibacteria bacterium]MBK7031838.1 hypothetical protein [Ignavibacteria bacterium]MBK7411312.1 hypothetical protein [Ignavibacteria bacterium]MBK7577931.1 hypothetical protein [Ignavibacteria bacterium]